MFKYFISFHVVLFLSLNTYAQEAEKTVSITVSGIGKTQEEAKQSALRSAIEQAFGAFISSKREILNDQIVSDQIASVSNGNIQSFTILNESQLPDGSWGLTIKALVSISKLTSFVESKGVTIEIKGGLFALNIKQQLLNEQGEVKAVEQMIGLLHEPMQISFDYTIKSGEPIAADKTSQNWEIPLVVNATANKNMDFCANYFIKTLTALSLSAEEVTNYKSLNKDVFPIKVSFNGAVNLYFLRGESSINAIKTLTSQWEFYTRLFTVKSGIDETNGNGKVNLHKFIGSNEYWEKGIEMETVYFISSGEQAAIFSWDDKRTLSQIEQMTGYTVKSRGVVSQFKHGGFVVFEENGHGLVVAISDLEGNWGWESGKTACDSLILNGYNDWHLPSLNESNTIIANLIHMGLGGFGHIRNHWSATEDDTETAWLFSSHGLVTDQKSAGYLVRAVRTF